MNKPVNIKNYYDTLICTERATIFANNKLSKIKDTKKKKDDKNTFFKQNYNPYHKPTLAEILKSCLEQGPSPYPLPQQEHQLPLRSLPLLNHLQQTAIAPHPSECKVALHRCNSADESYS